MSRRLRSDSPEARLIVVSANTSWALSNYRLGLLNAIQKANYSVIALVPDAEQDSILVNEGIAVRSIPIAAHGTSLFRELWLLYRYVRILRELRPAAYLGFTVKPNIYGALAGRVARVPVINNVTGLGMVFVRGGLLRTVVKVLYRIALQKSRQVFFQNRESRDLFLSQGFIREDQAAVLPGSGIDLHRFEVAPTEQELTTNFTFLLACRLIWEKGVGEFCAAARWFRLNHPGVCFQLLGPIESESNAAAIPRQRIDEWQQEGVEYLGSTDDVRPFIRAADCIVLPSFYPEGVPRVLIEAAAMGKPVITTDMPGCRDVVEAGSTGYLCEPKSVQSLTAAMLEMVRLPLEVRAEMGTRARMKVEREFDERIVIDAYLAAIDANVSR